MQTTALLNSAIIQINILENWEDSSETLQVRYKELSRNRRNRVASVGYVVIDGWFLCLMAHQLFLGYLMPKPFS